MMYLPDCIDQNEECLKIFNSDWKERKLIDFVLLFNEMLLVLEKLANNKNPISRKIYLIIIEIFEEIESQTDKKEYLV